MLERTVESAAVVVTLVVLSLILASTNALAYQTYTVRWADSLYKISQKYGVSVSSIKEVNGLSSNEIWPGQTLLIGDSRSAPSGNGYTVRTGDTLYLIARRNGVSVSSLKSANGLTSDVIYVGQKLVIPNPGSSTPPSNQSSSYVVQPGDSLYWIAQSHGVSVESLKQANDLRSDSIYPGQTLLIPKSGQPNEGISQSDRDLLARLVHSESSGEPYEGKVAVAATILNRVSSPAYPNSIPGVIYQVVDGRYYQYEPVLNGTINRPAGSESYRAADAALGGWDPSRGAIGFYNPAKTSNQWVKSRPITIRIGNHVFFR